MEDLPQASEYIAKKQVAQPMDQPEVVDRIKEHLYQRACNRVVSFFQSQNLAARVGQSDQVGVLKVHLGNRLPEFLAWVQSKGYVTEVGDNTVLVSAPDA